MAPKRSTQLAKLTVALRDRVNEGGQALEEAKRKRESDESVEKQGEVKKRAKSDVGPPDFEISWLNFEKMQAHFDLTVEECGLVLTSVVGSHPEGDKVQEDLLEEMRSKENERVKAERLAKERAAQERAERAAAKKEKKAEKERAKAEQEKAEREKAEREKVEREKAEAETQREMERFNMELDRQVDALMALDSDEEKEAEASEVQAVEESWNEGEEEENDDDVETSLTNAHITGTLLDNADTQPLEVSPPPVPSIAAPPKASSPVTALPAQPEARKT